MSNKSQSDVLYSSEIFRQYLLQISTGIVWKNTSRAINEEPDDVNSAYQSELFVVANRDLLNFDIIKAFPRSILRNSGIPDIDIEKYAADKTKIPEYLRKAVVDTYQKAFKSRNPVTGRPAFFNALTGKYEVIYEDCKKGLILAVNCRSVQPQFGGQTKEKVNNPAIRTDARKLMSKALEKYFIENQSVLKKIVDYLRKIARIRLEAHGIKGIDVKKTTSWIDDADIKEFTPLADRNSKGYKELILTEGLSAAGGIEAVRNAQYQAVFQLSGVVDNAFNQSLARALKNDTLRKLVKVLGCGIGSDFNIANLKWNKIIITTDKPIITVSV